MVAIVAMTTIKMMKKKSNSMRQELLKIRGMHCVSCAGTIEKAVQGLKGVAKASVNSASETLALEFDQTQVSLERISKAVSDVGYKLVLPDPTKYESNEIRIRNSQNSYFVGKTTLHLKVLGMDSPHCAMTVEKAIKTLPGIENVEVDFNNSRAKVVFASEATNRKAILEVITTAGYKPLEEQGETPDLLEQEKQERGKELRDLKIKVLTGGILSVFIFLGSFPEWFSFVPKFLTLPLVLLPQRGTTHFHK